MSRKRNLTSCKPWAAHEWVRVVGAKPPKGSKAKRVVRCRVCHEIGVSP